MATKKIDWKPGDTEQECFNRSLFCGELPKERFDHLAMVPDTEGCGARNWCVFQRGGYPPWTRFLVCQGCGNRVDVELEGLKRRSNEDVCGLRIPQRLPD